jgi:hypothetical protein
MEVCSRDIGGIVPDRIISREIESWSRRIDFYLLVYEFIVVVSARHKIEN